MLKKELIQFAAQLGFVHTYVCELPDYSMWQMITQEMNHPLFGHLTADVTELFDGECRAVLMIWPYVPYAEDSDGATVSAYYPSSTEANAASECVAQWLNERGYRALGHPNIPYKTLITQAGHAQYGKNGVTAIDGLGSRYAIQVVLTDAPLEIDPGKYDPSRLSDSCSNCGRCVQACPVGALDGTSRVDIHRCIRSKADEYPLQAEYRPLIGSRLFGCDICQDVCPRNGGIGIGKPSQALSDALALEKLLCGDVQPLVPYLGKNYVRKARMQAKACIIAANMNRRDLVDRIEQCLNSPVDFVRDHAAWALEKLK